MQYSVRQQACHHKVSPASLPVHALPAPILHYPPSFPVQHPDVCCVSVHPECTGMPFPTGNYICANHDNGELKARIGRRRRASTARRGDEQADLGDVLSDETEDEETEDEEGGRGGGDARSGGSGGGGGKKKADSDSEATVSEATASLDSSATEDEGTTSKRRRKR